MPEGEYELGGQQVLVKDRQARLRDGTLAGAALNLYDDMVNAIRFGIPAEDAVLAATLLPAREVLIDKETGSLEEGKLADFLVCDPQWNLQQVYIGGQEV
jgi:N-acetylglucosamine-6-phosphate deacetylase